MEYTGGRDAYRINYGLQRPKCLLNFMSGFFFFLVFYWIFAWDFFLFQIYFGIQGGFVGLWNGFVARDFCNKISISGINFVNYEI